MFVHSTGTSMMDLDPDRLSCSVPDDLADKQQNASMMIDAIERELATNPDSARVAVLHRERRCVVALLPGMQHLLYNPR